MMIPGLEKELTGMKVGGEKHVTVKPEDGYGKVNPNAVQEIPKEKFLRTRSRSAPCCGKSPKEWSFDDGPSIRKKRSSWT